MTITFRRAVRENEKLIIVVAGGTGSGKTFSAMRLAKGIAGDKPFAVIDTENGRAKHYADFFTFDHADLRAPFSPDAYADAIAAADKAGYPVILVDQASYEHAGEGGLLDMQEAELDRMAGDNYSKREACKMASWVKPKAAHKRFMRTLLNVNAQLILCLRAEEKVDMVKGEDGKMKVVPKKSLAGRDGWIPIAEKNLPFEATASFLLLAGAPGVPNPIKLEKQHAALFPPGEPITEACGARLADWARGAGAKPAAAAGAPPAEPGNASGDLLTPEQVTDLENRLNAIGTLPDKLLAKVGAPTLRAVRASDFGRCVAWINVVADRKAEAAK